MSEEKNSTDRTQAKNKDITPLLKGWDYEPGTINVRKVTGLDGAAKLQMRLDLGLLQMEMMGRPDGARPHGCESLLEFYETTELCGQFDNWVGPNTACLLAIGVDGRLGVGMRGGNPKEHGQG